MVTVFELRRVSDSSEGVYHYFERNSEPSAKNYLGSCYTLSDQIGECTFYLFKSGFEITVDFPYSSLSEWREIVKSTDYKISELFC